MLRSVELEHYMIKNPVTISKDAGLLEAVNLILSNKVSGLCVTDDAGHLIGILSEIDCLQGILSATYNQSTVGEVCEYMAGEEIDVAKPGDDIISTALDMMKNGQRRRPVVDKDNKLLGQITCRQLLTAVNKFNSPE